MAEGGVDGSTPSRDAGRHRESTESSRSTGTTSVASTRTSSDLMHSSTHSESSDVTSASTSSSTTGSSLSGSGTQVSTSTSSGTQVSTSTSTTGRPIPDGGCFCGCTAPDAQFCDDFDGVATGSLNEWSEVQHAGTVAVESTTSLSHPNAVSCGANADAGSVGAISYAFPGSLGTEATLGLDVYVGGGCSAAGGFYDTVAALQFSDFSVDVLMTTGFALVIGQATTSTPTPLSSGLDFPSGRWIPVSLSFDAQQSTATLTVDGITTSAQTTGGPPDVTDATIWLGVDVAGHDGCTLLFDNVTFAWGQ